MYYYMLTYLLTMLICRQLILRQMNAAYCGMSIAVEYYKRCTTCTAYSSNSQLVALRYNAITVTSGLSFQNGV